MSATVAAPIAARVPLTSLDSALTATLDPRSAAVAAHHATVPVHVARAGEELDLPEDIPLTLIIDGLMACTRGARSHATLEVHGPGDVAASAAEDGRAPVWTALQAARLAVLDDTFLAIAGRIPALNKVLVNRVVARSVIQSEHLAAATLPHIEDRLLAFFGVAARRWGHVTADGVSVDLPLTHEQLGCALGARRSTVTLGLSSLARRGPLTRRPDGRWLLSRTATESFTAGGR
jgi:CRP-like cAMP-binding protein